MLSIPEVEETYIDKTNNNQGMSSELVTENDVLEEFDKDGLRNTKTPIINMENLEDLVLEIGDTANDISTSLGKQDDDCQPNNIISINDNGLLPEIISGHGCETDAIPESEYPQKVIPRNCQVFNDIIEDADGLELIAIPESTHFDDQENFIVPENVQLVLHLNPDNTHFGDELSFDIIGSYDDP